MQHLASDASKVFPRVRDCGETLTPAFTSTFSGVGGVVGDRLPRARPDEWIPLWFASERPNFNSRSLPSTAHTCSKVRERDL